MRFVQIGAEGIGGEAIAQRIGDTDRVLDGVERHDPCDRTKGFLGHETAVGGGVGDHGRLEEEAAACNGLAAGHHLAAITATIGDHRFHRRDPAEVRERTHVDAFIKTGIADLELTGARRKFGDEAVVDFLRHEEARRRDADLAGIAELGRRAHRHRARQIGVLADNHRRMAAQFGGEALHIGRSQRAQLLAHRSRAGEADLAGDRRGDQVLGHRPGIAINEVQHARRHACIDKALHQQLRRSRGVLGRLEDRGAACRQRAGDLFGGQVHGEVPRGEQHRGADRFVGHHLRDKLVAPGRDQAAAAALGFLAEEVDRVAGREDFADALRVGLAHLGGDDAGDGRRAGAQQVGGAAQDRMAFRARGAAPCGKGIVGGLQCGIELRGRGLGALADHRAGRRVDHVHRARFAGFDPCAVDEHFQSGVGGHGRAPGFDSTLRELEILLR